MKKRFYIFVFCLLFNLFGVGQNPKTDSLLSILKTTKEDTTRVNVFNNLFLEFEFTNEEKASEYLNKALELSQKIDYRKGLANTHIHLGYFLEDKGDYTEASKNYFVSLKIYKTIGDKKGEADSYSSIGNVYSNQGNYSEALKNYFASLKITEAMNDLKGISVSYNNIGNIYADQKNYPEALKNYFACLKISETLGDKQSIATLCNNIGLVYFSQGNYQEALKNYFSSLKIREEIGNKAGVSASFNNIGIVYSEQAEHDLNPTLRGDKLDLALKNHFASLKIKEEIGDKAGIAASYNNIGIVFIKKKQYKEADEYLSKGKEAAKEIGYIELLKYSYNDLTALDSARGDFKGAYENHKLYILYRDSLDNEETRKKTVQTQMTYDFEKKEAVADAEHKKELENQQILAEEKNRKQKVVLLLVSCFLILILVFSGFIFRSLRVTRKQKNIIEEQKELVEEKQKEIIDSINYARRIQRSLLPTEKYIEKSLKKLMKG